MSHRVPWSVKLVFVGEQPAPGCPHAALGTALCPCTSSGRRLAELVGEPLERRCGALNLLEPGPWNPGWAQVEARALRVRAKIRASLNRRCPERYAAPPRFALLGARVRDAFFPGKTSLAQFEWRDDEGFRYVLMPHPSGRSREWNDSETARQARAMLRVALEETPCSR